MYRVAYTYIGPHIPDVATTGDRREILFSTSHAFTAYETRCAWPQARDVLLAEYHDGVWTTIKQDRPLPMDGTDSHKFNEE